MLADRAALGGEVRALFLPHERCTAIAIHHNSELRRLEQFDNREAALQWAEGVRVRLLEERLIPAPPSEPEP